MGTDCRGLLVRALYPPAGSATDRVQIEPGADQSLPPATYAFIFEEASQRGLSLQRNGQGWACIRSESRQRAADACTSRPAPGLPGQQYRQQCCVALAFGCWCIALPGIGAEERGCPLVIELHAWEESGVEHADFALPCPSHSPSVYQVQVWALPGADQVNYVAGVPSAVVEVTITPYATASEMATALHALTIEGSACGTQLIAAFPNLTPDTLAIAMAQGGYPAIETSNGLLTVWPDTPPLELATVLALAYPDPLQFAASQRDQGVPGELCAVNLLKAFPQLGVSEMARAMAKAGYPQRTPRQASRWRTPPSRLWRYQLRWCSLISDAPCRARRSTVQLRHSPHYKQRLREVNSMSTETLISILQSLKQQGLSPLRRSKRHWPSSSHVPEGLPPTTPQWPKP